MALPTAINQKKLNNITTTLRGLGIQAGQTDIEKFGSVLEKMLNQFGITLTDAIKKNAVEKGNFTQSAGSSGLVKSTRHTVDAVGATGVKMQIHVADYYDYVNEGVDGVIRKSGSPYSYKSKMPPRQAVAEYIVNKSGLLSSLVSKNPDLYSGLDKKTQVERLSKLMQREIFLYGTKGSRFYDEVVNQQNLNLLADAILEATGKVIVFSLKSGLNKQNLA